MKKDSKLVRMLGKLGFCEDGMKIVRRRYGGKTLQQAWRTASASHLKEVCEKLNVRAPVPCKVCGTSCYWVMGRMKPNEFRSHFKGIPAKLRSAYAKA